MKEQSYLARYALLSIGLTLSVIISKAPLDNRLLRLGLYGGVVAGGIWTSKQLNQYFNTRQYKEITENLMDAKEIKKLRRAYQIKRAEADEDKKALAKYKYDPQSYH